MNITIIGAYGCGNAGDESLLEGIITKVKSYNADAKIEVLAQDGLYIQQLFSITTVSQILTRGLTWEVIRNFDFLGIIRSIYSSNLVIIGGGSLIHERTKYNLIYYYCLTLWAKITGSKVYFIGLSISTINSYWGKWIGKKLFSLGDYITVRDKISYNNIQALNPSTNFCQSWDLAFLNPESSLTKHDLHKLELPESFIGINLCGWFRSEEYWKPNPHLQNHRIKQMAILVDQLVETYGENIVFINTVIPNDSEVCYEVLKHVRYKSSVVIIDQVLSPYELKQVIAKARALVGMRLHSLIFAALMGTPFVAFGYDEKVRAFVDRLEIPEIKVLEIEELNNTHYVVNVIKSTYNNQETIKTKLNKVTKQFNRNLWEEDWNI